MNLGGLFLLLVIIIGAVFGLAYIGSRMQTNVTDTYGQALSNQTNISKEQVGGILATGQQVGGAAVLVVAGMIAASILLLLILVATGKL